MKGCKKEMAVDETKEWISNIIIKEEIIIEDSFKQEETTPDCTDSLEECQTCLDYQARLPTLARENTRVEFISLTQSFESHKLLHISSVGKKLSCNECGERFAWAKEVKRHRLAVHGYFKCEFCHKRFLQRGNLRSHKRARHKVIDVYNCDSCGEPFFALNALVKHLKSHNAVVSKREKCRRKSEGECAKGPFRCDLCSKSFVADFYLENHRAKIHSRRALKDLQKVEGKKKRGELYECLSSRKDVHECEACGITFGGLRELERHRLIHMRIQCVNLGRLEKHLTSALNVSIGIQRAR